MKLSTSLSMNPVSALCITRFMLLGFILVLIGTGVLPSLAQETPYADPLGQFTAAIPAGWSDESTADYGLFTNSGTSFYLLTVEGSDIQANIDTTVALLAPDLASAAITPIGDVPSPSGTWTQVMYGQPDGELGIAAAQSNGSVTVVLFLKIKDAAALQPLSNDIQAMITSINIQGVPRPTPEAPADVAATTPEAQVAGEITFPELTGPYAVGRTRIIWTDDSREENYTPETGDPRVVTVWVWYPATPGADADIAPYLPGGMSDLFQQLFGIGSSNVHDHAYDSVPVLTSESGYPVLVYSPGDGYNALFSSSLLEEIASHGYVVVGLDHSYNALLTTLADGQVVIRPEEGIDESEAGFATRIADVEFVIDQLAQLNSSDALLQGSLNLEQMGLIGHSFGGQTVAEVCRMDVRCQAVIISDVPLRGEVAETGLPQPIMLLDTERITSEQTIQEAEELSGQPIPDSVSTSVELTNSARETTANMLLATWPDAYRVIIDGTRHNNFTDVPLLATIQPALRPHIGGISTIVPERAQRVISDYMLAFFDSYLRGEHSPLLEGASNDYPEVTFKRHES